MENIASLLQALPDVVFTPDFAMACVIVFFLCEALFKIPYLNDMIWGKQAVALIVGALIGVAKWGLSADAIILGVIAGGVSTLAVARIDRWMSSATSKKKK